MENKTKQNMHIPQDGIAGLKAYWKEDALSGFLVFLLALPLSLGIAKASDFPNPLWGVFTAIVGGIIVSFFMGARLTIKGPAAGLIVIVSGCVGGFGGGEAGWHLALGAIVTAGVLQILFGLLKFGDFADFFPGAAIHGMLAAIGLIIISKQFHLMLGINPGELTDPVTHRGKEPMELLGMIPWSLQNMNQSIAVVGIGSLLIMAIFGTFKFLKKIPGPLVVLAFAIPMGIYTLSAVSPDLKPLVKTGYLTEELQKHAVNVDFSGASSHIGVFIQYVILFALIGTLESLLTAKAMDGLDPYKRKSNFNKDVTAVGFGNVIAGIFGGLPMISEVARSSANIGYGAKTRWANFFHGIFLLLALLLAVPIIEKIPNASLAAMLIFVGYRLAHPRTFKHAYHTGTDQLFIFVATIVVTVATDLLIGVGTGILLEFLVNFVHGTSFANVFKSHANINENGNEVNVNLSGDFVFSNLIGYKKKLQAIATGKHIILDMSELNVIDHTSMVFIKAFKEDYERSGGKVTITGLENHKAVAHDSTSTHKRLKTGKPVTAH